MDILSLRLYLRVAELGGISAAARDLSLSPASASARLAKLEENLGFRLFNRTTRAVSLTTDGAAFQPFAIETLETLEAGVGAIKGTSRAASGLLRMTMPGSLARMHIIPALGEFHERYPHISLDLRLSDEVLDVVKGAFDLIIRNAKLEDSSLIARRLAADHRLLVASPEYLARHGIPRSPMELKDHQCIVFPGASRWTFRDAEAVEVPQTHIVNDGEVMRSLIESGLGIGVKSLWNAGESLQSGRLVEVLPDYPLLTESAIWAVYPSRRIVAPKVRVMLDFLQDLFASKHSSDR